MHKFIRTFVIAALVSTILGPAFAADQAKKQGKAGKSRNDKAGRVFGPQVEIKSSGAQAQNSEQQEKPRKTNKGAGVSQEILDAYEARVFDGMPYRSS